MDKSALTNYLNFPNSTNAIVTLAIGKKFLNSWEKFSKPSWEIYCKKYKINLFVITKQLISKSEQKWKKPTWQKLLIGDFLRKLNLSIENICYLDTDILISPLAENIFAFSYLH